MKKLLGLTLLLVSIAAPIPAPAQSFGELFPVTNTRYDAAMGTPRLAENGRDFFLFWASERKIRATSLAQPRPSVGQVVLDTDRGFDVAWTGEVFLAVSSRRVYDHPYDAHIIGRVLDAEARPISGELALAEHGGEPRIAAGPESMVMVYRGTAGDTRVLVSGPRGESTGAESRRLHVEGSYDVAGTDTGFVIALSSPEELRTITLDRQGRAVAEHSLARPSRSYREIALATDGNRYLMAWSGENLFLNEVAAVSLDENGAMGTPLVIRDLNRSPSPVSAVWTGAGWSVSYESELGDQSRARIAHLDRNARTILAEEQSAVVGVENPTLAALNQRIMAAWNRIGRLGDPTSVIELPLATHQPRVATYAATEQILLATASSADATLMVWRESGEAGKSYVGVRTHDGRWTESELAVTGYDAAAASDGRQFVVIIRDALPQLIRLDGRGRPLAPPKAMKITNDLPAISWNGTHYAIVEDMKGMLLSPSGVLSESVGIRYQYSEFSYTGRSWMASNGDGFLLVVEEHDCIEAFCFSSALKAMRLDAGLRRLDAEEILLNPDSGNAAGVVWNGSEYVVAWSASDGFYTARVPATAGASITKTFTYENFDATGIASMPDGTIAIAGSAGSSSNVTRVAFLRNDGSIARSFHIDSSAVIGRRLLTALPDGVAYVASSIQDLAPHHGTSHVMMAIARSSVPPPPHPPHVHARLQNGVILVDWSPSAGTVNGYRLEYRVDGGSWNELEEWFPASANHRTIRPTFGTNFEIRMRAFNDGGASAYSATALTKPTRRRAAR